MSKVAISGNASGTGTFTIAAPNSNSDRTITLPDEAGTVLTSASETVLPKGGPAFSAYRSGSTQSLSGASYNLIQFDTESFDTAGCYNTSTYAFTPTVAGYYYITLAATIASSSTAGWLLIRKNNTTYVKSGMQAFLSGSLNAGGTTNGLVYFNGTTDYVQGYIYVPTTVNLSQTDYQTYFEGFLVRAA